MASRSTGLPHHLDAMQQVSFPISTSRQPSRLSRRRQNTPIPRAGSRRRRRPQTTTPRRRCARSWVPPSTTEKNQSCKNEARDAGLSRTVDEEISATFDFSSARPKKTASLSSGTTWHVRMSRLCCRRYEGHAGRASGKDWGVNEAGMKQMTTPSAMC